jgi:nicotinamide mononucleotide (NMN) deamidase PncC
MAGNEHRRGKTLVHGRPRQQCRARQHSDELLDDLCAALAEEERILGTVECGVNGIVSRTIFEADEGPLVLGDSLILEDVEQAIDVLGLPRPQFKATGTLSAKAARAAAREGQALLGVDICLAVWSEPPAESPDVERPAPVYLAVASDEGVQEDAFQPEAGAAQGPDALVARALQMVRWVL